MLLARRGRLDEVDGGDAVRGGPDRGEDRKAARVLRPAAQVRLTLEAAGVHGIQIQELLGHTNGLTTWSCLVTSRENNSEADWAWWPSWSSKPV